MPVNIDDFLSLKKEAYRVNSITSARKLLSDVCATYGYSHYIYLLNTGNIASPDFVSISNQPKIWWKRYREENYDAINMLFKHVLKSALPFNWRDINRHNIIRQNAKDIGFSEGVSIPLISINSNIGLVCFSTDSFIGMDQSHTDAFEPYLVQISHILHERILDIHKLTPEHYPRLTTREIECLTWAAAGSKITEIAEKLFLSPNTIKKHLDAAKLKLGAKSYQHAAHLAVSRGMININI